MAWCGDFLVNKRLAHQALVALACKLDSSPLPASERACTVKLADGTTRLGVTQVVQYVNHGGEFAGALFCRISFRFAGQDSLENIASYSSTHDVAWFIVDHKTGYVQFGPLSGLKVRSRGLGIGSYIIGQLVRLLHGGSVQGNYRVRTMNVPPDVSGALPAGDLEVNDAMVEYLFDRAGFYVSKAAGKRVVGARRAADLRSQWNGEKVRFLNPGQLIDTAANALAEAAEANIRSASYEHEHAALQVARDRKSRDLERVTGELSAAQGQIAQCEQAARIREADFAVEAEGYRVMMADLRKQLEAAVSGALPPIQDSSDGVAIRPSASQTTMVIELGATAKMATWAAIVGLAFLSCAVLYASVFR